MCNYVFGVTGMWYPAEAKECGFNVEVFVRRRFRMYVCRKTVDTRCSKEHETLYIYIVDFSVIAGPTRNDRSVNMCGEKVNE